MHGAQNTFLNAYHTPRKKCTCTRACAPMRQWRKFFAMETIANLSWILHEHRAGFRLLPAQLLSRPNLSPDAVRSRNLSKSTLAHDAVAAAVSHKHLSVIRVGAGLIALALGCKGLWFALALGCKPHSLHKIVSPPLFSRAFSKQYAEIPGIYKYVPVKERLPKT